MSDKNHSNQNLSSVASDCSTAPPLLAIGAVYENLGVPVVLRGCRTADNGGHLCYIDSATEPGMYGRHVHSENLRGPLNVPCPFCGELKPLTHSAGGIDLSEHMDRCMHFIGQ